MRPRPSRRSSRSGPSASLQVPTAFAADPATHPAWFATYGYPTSYAGPRATVPPAELSIQTIMMLALVALAAAVLVRVGVTTLRSPRATI
jgi:hypothetical protein